MNTTLKLLQVLNMFEEVQLSTIYHRIQARTDYELSYSDKCNIRCSLSKLADAKIIEKRDYGGFLWYALVKDKDEYTPRYADGYVKRNPTRIAPPKTNAVEWYGRQKVHSLETLSKQLNLPMPKSKEQIVEFYNKAIGL